MRKVTINPENWVNDEIEVTINDEKNTLEVNGYVFELVPTLVSSDFECYDIFNVENGKRNEFRTGTVGRMLWKDQWERWEACQGEVVQRDHKECRFLAAAKLVAYLY